MTPRGPPKSWRWTQPLLHRRSHWLAAAGVSSLPDRLRWLNTADRERTNRKPILVVSTQPIPFSGACCPLSIEWNPLSETWLDQPWRVIESICVFIFVSKFRISVTINDLVFLLMLFMFISYHIYGMVCFCELWRVFAVLHAYINHRFFIKFLHNYSILIYVGFLLRIWFFKTSMPFR